MSREVDPENIVMGEEGQKELAPHAFEVYDGGDSEPVKMYIDEDGIQHRIDLGADTSVQEETEIWLRRQGVDKALVQGLGKGPDGIALAKVAARRLKGKENGEIGKEA